MQHPLRPAPFRAVLISGAIAFAGVSSAHAGDVLASPRASKAAWDTTGTALPVSGACGVAADQGLFAFKSASLNIGLAQECVRLGESGAIRFAAEPSTAIVSPVVGEQQAGFGDALALFGGSESFPPRLVVGAPLEDHGATANAGAIYIYDRLEGIWVLRARIVAPDATADDRFGTSVSISDDDPTVIAVGAPFADGGGAAYRVNFTLAGAQSVGRLNPRVAIDADARLGKSVAVTAGLIAAGAPDDLGFSGRVHVFDASTRDGLAEINGTGIEGMGFAVDAREGFLMSGCPWAASAGPGRAGGRVRVHRIESLLGGGVVESFGDILPGEFGDDGYKFGRSISMHPRGVSVSMTAEVSSLVGVVDFRAALGAPAASAVGMQVSTVVAPTSFDHPPAVACMGDVLLVGARMPGVASDGAEALGVGAVSCRAYDMRVGGRDQDLDSVDDLLLVKPTTGSARIWTLDGAARDASYDATEGAPPAAPLALGANWVCLGTADLWGNSRFSTLWRHKTTMQLRALQANGPEFSCLVTDVAIPPAFGVAPGVVGKVLGIADTNGDRTTDLLVLENGTTVVEHAMRGAEIVSRREIANIAGHAFLGLGDFNGDGVSDAILRKLSNNRLRLLAIAALGAEIVDFATEGPGPAIVFPSNLDVAATGDFTRDGADDMVVFNATTRQVQIWSFEGVIRRSRTNVGGPIGAGWAVRAALDADGDFDPDIVLTKAATRSVSTWQMQGTTKLGLTMNLVSPVGFNVLNGVEQRR